MASLVELAISAAGQPAWQLISLFPVCSADGRTGKSRIVANLDVMYKKESHQPTPSNKKKERKRERNGIRK